MSENTQANIIIVRSAGSLRTPAKPSTQTASRLLSTPASTRPQSASLVKSKIPFQSSPSTASVCSSVIGSSAKDAAKAAKEQCTAERIRKVSELKVKWKEEKSKKIDFHNHKKEQSRRSLQESLQSAATLRRKEFEAQQAFIQSQKGSSCMNMFSFLIVYNLPLSFVLSSTIKRKIWSFFLRLWKTAPERLRNERNVSRIVAAKASCSMKLF